MRLVNRQDQMRLHVAVGERGAEVEVADLKRLIYYIVAARYDLSECSDPESLADVVQQQLDDLDDLADSLRRNPAELQPSMWAWVGASVPAPDTVAVVIRVGVESGRLVVKVSRQRPLELFEAHQNGRLNLSLPAPAPDPDRGAGEAVAS